MISCKGYKSLSKPSVLYSHSYYCCIVNVHSIAYRRWKHAQLNCTIIGCYLLCWVGLNNSEKIQVGHRATCWLKSGYPHQGSGSPLPNGNKVYVEHLPIAKWNGMSSEFAVLKIIRISYISEKMCTLHEICSHTYSSIASRFPLLRGNQYFRKGSSCLLNRWH